MRRYIIAAVPCHTGDETARPLERLFQADFFRQGEEGPTDTDRCVCGNYLDENVSKATVFVVRAALGFGESRLGNPAQDGVLLHHPCDITRVIRLWRSTAYFMGLSWQKT